jgi:hypothetical protein
MTCYRTSESTGERHYVSAYEQLESLVGQLQAPEAQQSDHGEVEARIWEGGRELLRRLMQGYLDQRSGEEEAQAGVHGADGEARTHRRRDCSRKLETRFGTVEVRRIGYSGRGLDSVFPLDAALNLPPDRYSHGLRKSLIEEAIRNSFDDSLGQMKRNLGGHLPKRQAEELVVALGRDFTNFYAQPLEPQASQAGSERILVITADGKGIVMHPSGLREATRRAAEAPRKKMETRLSPGEKANRKRMATAVSVYEIAPHVRTPEQILQPEQHPQGPRPVPAHKRTWARVEEDLAGMIEEGFAEAFRRDPEQTMRWVVLTDGQDELIRQVHAAAARYEVEVTLVQDFVHALEYLWKAAHALHPDDPAAREDWVLDRADALLRGKARDVAIGMRRAATRAQLSADERKPVDKAANYLEKSQDRLRYDQALEQGLPIATGVIEGACRHLIKDRMDITGARWGLERAEAILRLRSLKVSGDLDAYLGFHFQREQRRNYPETALPCRLSEAA